MKKIASIDKKERYAKNEHTLNIRYVCKDHGENANALKAVNPCNMLIVGSHQYFRPLQLIFCEIIDFTPYAPQINTYLSSSRPTCLLYEQDKPARYRLLAQWERPHRKN